MTSLSLSPVSSLQVFSRCKREGSPESRTKAGPSHRLPWLPLPVFLLLVGCAAFRPPVALTPDEIRYGEEAGLGARQLRSLESKPLYKFSPAELDRYLAYLQKVEPDLRHRLQHLARKMIGQPYKIFLLGEFPFEVFDPDPLFSLRKSDCVVFSEHMYAMALAQDWQSFFALLQRIRYKDGIISVLTRNHYTEADWDVNNRWLVEDMTERLAGPHVRYDTVVIDRARFFAKWGIGQDIPPDTVLLSWIPYQFVPQIVDSLQPGDFVNVVRGHPDGRWVGHVGLITVSPDGRRNFLHSSKPKVREEPLLGYATRWHLLNQEIRAENERIERENARRQRENQRRLQEAERKGKKPKLKQFLPLRPTFWGFKFLRLRQDPLEQLRLLDGPDAPHVQGPLLNLWDRAPRTSPAAHLPSDTKP